MNETIAMPENIRQAFTKYNSYDPSCWTQAYFDYDSGGFNVYHKLHQFSSVQSGGDVEKKVGKMLAKYSAKQVEFLAEQGDGHGMPDVMFDNQTWDIKFVNNANENTMRRYIKDARKADNAIFYFTTDKYDSLLSAVNREVGYLQKWNRLSDYQTSIIWMKKEFCLCFGTNNKGTICIAPLTAYSPPRQAGRERKGASKYSLLSL